jgi:hypothetical protein
MKWMIPAAIAACAFAAAFGGIWFFTYDGRPKCDDAAVVETVKSLATERLSTSPDYLIKNTRFKSFKIQLEALDMLYIKPPLYALSAFRDRGPFGKYGTNCAAAIKAVFRTGDSADFSTTYSVEPTSDGKTMVTARFQPTN